MKVFKAYRAPLYTAHLKAKSWFIMKSPIKLRVLIFKAVSRDLRFGGLILMRMKS